MNLKSATANMIFRPSRADSQAQDNEKSKFFWSKLSSYQKKLLIFLSVATFFEGYDLLALTQILPEIRTQFGLTPTYGGSHQCGYHTVLFISKKGRYLGKKESDDANDFGLHTFLISVRNLNNSLYVCCLSINSTNLSHC